MSRGIGGYMNLIAADDTMLIYSYCCYNLNNDDWREMQKMEDGEIFIDRAALVEPEIHRKMKRTPSGRKMLIEKRVPRDYSFSDMLGAGQVTIKNASGTWMKSPDGIDLMACKMLYKFFREYQETGVIQEHIGYFC